MAARSPCTSTAWPSASTGSARPGSPKPALRLDQLADRAICAVRKNLDDRRHLLARLAASLEALSPLSVLARGYSLTFQADGTTLVRSSDDVRDGDIIVTRLSSGQIRSRVVSAPPSLS